MNIKLNGIRRNYIDTDWKYKHSFSICYEKYSYSTFKNKKVWFHKEKKVFIPKIVNNLIRFIFGKRKYSIIRDYGDGDIYISELVSKKVSREYMKEYEEEGCTVIEVYEKEIVYSGWLWITKKEKKIAKEWNDLLLGIWS